MKSKELKSVYVFAEDLKITFTLTKSLTKELLPEARLGKNAEALATCHIATSTVEVVSISGGNVKHKGRRMIKSRTLLKRLDKMATVKMKAYIKLLEDAEIKVHASCL